MPPREVRFPVRELLNFLELDPRPEEIDAVSDCLAAINNGTVEGDPVPFRQYHEHLDCRVTDCGRFLIVYAFDHDELFPAAILLSSDYE